jgi:hypothetical protein
MGVGGGGAGEGVGLFIVSQPKLGKQKFGTFLNENLLRMKYNFKILSPNPKIDLVTPSPKAELLFWLSHEVPEHSSVRRAKRALGTDFRTGWAVSLGSDRGGLCNLEVCLSHLGRFFPTL